MISRLSREHLSIKGRALLCGADRSASLWCMEYGDLTSQVPRDLRSMRLRGVSTRRLLLNVRSDALRRRHLPLLLTYAKSSSDRTPPCLGPRRQSRAPSGNPPCATRCRVPSRCPQNSRSTAAGNKSQAEDLACPSSARKTLCIELRHNHRTRARAATESGGNKSGWLAAVGRFVVAIHSLVADRVCVCPSP